MKGRQSSFVRPVHAFPVIPALVLATGCPVAIGQTLTRNGDCAQSAGNAWAASCFPLGEEMTTASPTR